MAGEPALVEIGGRRLATWCTGDGDPPVLLETGLGAPASDWVAVQEGLETITRVCRYDRANCGASDPAHTPRTAADMASDLHALIKALGMSKPVLVGHSFGGPICLSFAAAWPDEIAGLVLVDPTHPEQFDTFGPLLPDQLVDMKEFWTKGWRTPDGTAERIDFQRTFAAIREIGSLGDLPLTVLTSGAWQFTDEAHQTWIRFHREYVALSNRGKQRVLPNTDHFLQRSAPNEVIEAISEVLDELRLN